MKERAYIAATEALRDDWGFSFVSFLVVVTAGTKVRFDIEAKFFRVLWGDGSDDGRRSHKYQYEGEYRVEIIGRKLKMLDVSYGFVTRLDMKACPCLEVLKCKYNGLEELDVSGCRWLKTLECGNNRIVRLSLPESKELEALDCGSNELEELDLTGFARLQQVVLYKNSLVNLSVKGCRSLCQVNVVGNRIGLEEMERLLEEVEEVPPGGRYGIFYGNRNPGYREGFLQRFLAKGWYFLRS